MGRTVVSGAVQLFGDTGSSEEEEESESSGTSETKVIAQALSHAAGDTLITPSGATVVSGSTLS